jgi:hypothetical protein
MDACRQPDINYGFHDFVPLTRKSHCSSSGVLICVNSYGERESAAQPARLGALRAQLKIAWQKCDCVTTARPCMNRNSSAKL